MANNPFDPPIVQVKKTLDRGGISSVNKGFGSTRMQSQPTRPAPTSAPPEWFPTSISEMEDVNPTPPMFGQTLVWNGSEWIPGFVGGYRWSDAQSYGPVSQSRSSGSFNGMTATLTPYADVMGVALDEVLCRIDPVGEYSFSINGEVVGTQTATTAGSWLTFDLRHTEPLVGPFTVSLERTNGANFRMYYTSNDPDEITGLGSLSQLNQSSGNTAPWEWHFHTFGAGFDPSILLPRP